MKKELNKTDQFLKKKNEILKSDKEAKLEEKTQIFFKN